MTHHHDSNSTLRRQLLTPSGEADCMVSRLDGIWQDVFFNPLSSKSFRDLEAGHLAAGDATSAQIAARRARQLVQIEANDKASASVLLYESLLALEANSADSIIIDEYEFAGLQLSESPAGRYYLAGISLDGSAFLKVALDGRPLEGMEALRALSEAGAVSSAGFLAEGTLAASELEALPAYQSAALAAQPNVKRGLPYLVLSHTRADRGGFGLGDLILTLLEQQVHGVYQNCISIERIRFDSLQGILRFSGFDHAIRLPDEIRALAPQAYIQWCIEQERSRVGQGGEASFLCAHASTLNKFFNGSRFQLGLTQIFGRQLLADAPVPSVQVVEEGSMVSGGNLALHDRIALLSDLPVVPGERVLDLGAGAGGIARYFASCGASVTAVDIDQQAVRQCSLLAAIRRCPVFSLTFDLEMEFPAGHFEMVLVLGLLPHITNRSALAQSIERCACQRILLEVGLSEAGCRWQGSQYQSVEPLWAFQDEAAMLQSVHALFPDFLAPVSLGVTDRGRTLYSLIRRGAGTL